MTEIQVLKTTKYSMFKRLEGNRDVKCVKKIIDSINKVGYIPNPIIVNQYYEVIDGQNRLQAAKELNLPVFYYIVKDIGINEARSMNLGRTNWKPIDYIRSYAESGSASYQMLLDLIEKFPIYSYQEICGFMSNTITTAGWKATTLIEDNFEISVGEYEMAKWSMMQLEDLLPTLSKIIGSKRLIRTSIAWCMNVEGVNIDRLKKVIRENYPLINPVVDGHAELFLRDLTQIYNNKLYKKNRIDFDVIYRNL